MRASATHRFAYRDEHGMLNVLDLPTEFNNPQGKALELFEEGVNVLISKYDIKNAMWTAWSTWDPTTGERRNKRRKIKSKLRSVKQLVITDRIDIRRLIKKGLKEQDIMEELRLQNSYEMKKYIKEIKDGG